MRGKSLQTIDQEQARIFLVWSRMNLIHKIDNIVAMSIPVLYLPFTISFYKLMNNTATYIQ